MSVAALTIEGARPSRARRKPGTNCDGPGRTRISPLHTSRNHAAAIWT